jgi:hypothetical protein
VTTPTECRVAGLALFRARGLRASPLPRGGSQAKETGLRKLAIHLARRSPRRGVRLPKVELGEATRAQRADTHTTSGPGAARGGAAGRVSACPGWRAAELLF